jgi:hypothetical protein
MTTVVQNRIHLQQFFRASTARPLVLCLDDNPGQHTIYLLPDTASPYPGPHEAQVHDGLFRDSPTQRGGRGFFEDRSHSVFELHSQFRVPLSNPDDAWFYAI